MAGDNKLSILIPSCNEPFLQKTLDSIFEAAEEEIEVIVFLDRYWPTTPLKKDKRLTLIHCSSYVGMRPAINKAFKISTGKYIMKCDGHCFFDKGFDVKLKADCEENWLVVPARYSMDAEKWERKRDPIHHLFLTYPCGKDSQYGDGLHGRKWQGPHGLGKGFYHREKERADILIDDILTFQGSCYFMHRSLFENIGMLDTVNYGTSSQEAQELGFKVWLSGGRCVRNKKTWYAHMHRGKDMKRGFWLSKSTQRQSVNYSYLTWMNNKWEGQVRDIKWLIDKFWPLDGWPEDWHTKEYVEGFKAIDKKG